MAADVIKLVSDAAGTAPSKTEIAARLRTLIRNGALALGARISDKQIASELNISRTPVREALVQLQSEGLVIMRPQSGTFVFNLTAQDVRQICAARAVLELGSLRLGAESIPKDKLAQLALLVGRASIALDDGDLALCDELDCEFHEALVATSANDYLIWAYASISDRLRALRQRMPRDPDRMARAIAHHRRIIDLWAADRIEAAANELSGHVSNVERLLTVVPQETRGTESA